MEGVWAVGWPRDGSFVGHDGTLTPLLEDLGWPLQCPRPACVGSASLCRGSGAQSCSGKHWVFIQRAGVLGGVGVRGWCPSQGIASRRRHIQVTLRLVAGLSGPGECGQVTGKHKGFRLQNSPCSHPLKGHE